ncbi:hypothetical protein Celaphus_00010210, partial [Cervus elaphus hippelaphus]
MVNKTFETQEAYGKPYLFTATSLVAGSLLRTGSLVLTGSYSKELMMKTANSLTTLLLYMLNENHLLLIHPIKRLLAGSIFAGLQQYSNNILPGPPIPQMTMP